MESQERDQQTPEDTGKFFNTSNSNLCILCARGLVLDDIRARGASAISSTGGELELCFLDVGKEDETSSGGGKVGFTWWSGGQYEQRHVTPPELPELSDGCKFCSAVKEAFLKKFGHNDWWKNTTTRLSFEVQYEWAATTFRDPDSSCREWLHIKGKSPDVEDAFSEQNIKMIREWIDQCDKDPGCYHLAEGHGVFPTRLLGVGENKGSPITLVDTKSIYQPESSSRPPKYISLSYCWGSTVPLKTTMDTLEQHRTGIPVDIIMPQIFRDAILVTRTLGIRYLWIDALCIIQGMTSDWEAESVKMADIFSNSYLTICAAASSSSDETLFYPRQIPFVDIPFQSSINPAITGEISILFMNEHYFSAMGADVENLRWNTRGWVWQEQHLSQRLLVFGERMVHWRCCRHMLHEWGTIEAPWRGVCDFSLEGSEHWSGGLTGYSQRKLTKPRDRLAALSGWVKTVSKAEPLATYLAGVWFSQKADADRQLRWVVQEPTLPIQEPTPIRSLKHLLDIHSNKSQYIAPSWSWAALNRPVHVLVNGTNVAFEKVTDNVEPAKGYTDATIAVKPGSSITLSGKLREVPTLLSSNVLVSECSFGNKWWKAPYEGGSWSRYVRGRERDVERHIRYFFDWDLSDWDELERISRKSQLKLFLTTLVSQCDGRTASGLLLFPANKTKAPPFYRVGCFEIYGPWKTPDWEDTKITII